MTAPFSIAPHPRPAAPSLGRTADLRHRRRLAAWVAAGAAPPGVAPSAVAAAHTRLTGRPPARDPTHRATRTYSLGELRAALAELASRSPRPTQPPPRPASPPPRQTPPPADPLPLADPLGLIWIATIQRLELPSTALLLRVRTQLIALHKRDRLVVAVVAVDGDWLTMVQNRRALVTRALGDTLACPIALELREVGQ